MRKLPIFILLLISTITLTFASQSDHLFKKGNRFYRDEQFDSATIYYEKCINTGIINSALYYNLANSYYRLNKKGLALLNYKRAKRLAPDDKDILANIKFSEMNITDKIPAPKLTIFEQFFLYLHNLISLPIQLGLLIVLLFILSILFSFALFTKENRRLWSIYFSIITFVVISIISLSAGIKIYQLEKYSYGVVLDSKAEALNAPDGNKTLFTLHEGTTVRLLKHNREWAFVSLANGVSGWIKQSALEKI